MIQKDSIAMLRRQLLPVLTGWPILNSIGSASLPPVRALTRGPKFHWFGYYDKLEFDPSGRYVLGMEVDFEHRSPLPSDRIQVGMVDTNDGDRWIPLGNSSAWNWQQGCMLQFLPGSKSEVIWNDRLDGQFVAHVLDIRSHRKRTIPTPVYALSPDGRWAIVCDFRRLNDMRPGYGYAGLPDPNKEVATPDDVGIWKVDLATGKRELIISIADAARIPYPGGYSRDPFGQAVCRFRRVWTAGRWSAAADLANVL